MEIIYKILSNKMDDVTSDETKKFKNISLSRMKLEGASIIHELIKYQLTKPTAKFGMKIFASTSVNLDHTNPRPPTPTSVAKTNQNGPRAVRR